MADPDAVEDVDELWSLLQAARRRGDEDAAARIRTRMADLDLARRRADLGDDELDRRIAALEAGLRIEPVRHTGVTEDSIMNQHADELNRRMAEGRDPAAVRQLDELLAERRRRGRRAPRAGGAQ